MEPTPDREESMLAEAMEEIDVQAPYRIESTDDEFVVRIRRSVASEEQVRRHLALMVIESISQKSQLTEEDALALGKEVNRAVSERMRHRFDAAGSTKEKALHVLQQLPADASVEDMIEKLYFISKVERGLQQIEAGQVVPHEEAKRRFGR